MLELNLILILMIIAAVVAIQIKDLLSSVIALGAVGMGLVLGFLLLRAPDLAITQLVVEILSVIILIRATVGTKAAEEKSFLPSRHILLGVVIVLTFLYFSFLALRELPKFGYPIMKIGSQFIAEALTRTKAANIVSAVILDFRAYDTLGEATILFASVVGVLAVLRKTGKRK